jgi:hypothetical protein
MNANIAQPYSVQPPLKISEAEMANWSGPRPRSNSKRRKRSERNILQEMNTYNRQSKEKGSGRNNGSCAKC